MIQYPWTHIFSLQIHWYVSYQHISGGKEVPLHVTEFLKKLHTKSTAHAVFNLTSEKEGGKEKTGRRQFKDQRLRIGKNL